MSLCPHPIRNTTCQLDEGHRGRHSTVTFYCDSCGQRRRGQPEASAYNPWDGLPEADFCWLCVNVLQPQEADHQVALSDYGRTYL